MWISLGVEALWQGDNNASLCFMYLIRSLHICFTFHVSLYKFYMAVNINAIM